MVRFSSDSLGVQTKSLCDMSESELFAKIKSFTKKFQLDVEYCTLVYDELVEAFHLYMRPLINYSSLNLYDNALSKFIMTHLGDEIPGCFLDEFKIYEDDETFQSDMNELKSYYSDIIDNGYGVSDSEFNELYRLSLVDEANSYYYFKYLLGQIIEGNNRVCTSMYQSIIKRFVNGVILFNDLRMNFRVGRLGRDDYITDSICRNGFNLSTFDKSHLNSKDVFYNLENIFHEVWHTVQEDEEYNDSDVVTLIKMDNYIRRVFGEEYYDDNYSVISSEVDADLHAVWLLAEFLREVSPETYKANKGLLTSRAEKYADLLYSNKRMYKGEEFDIDVLFDTALVSSGKTREEVLGVSSGEKRLRKEINF